MADMEHVLDKKLLEKSPSSKSLKLDESIPEHKEWVEYRRQNAKSGAAILSAQEREDIILALQEANELKLTLPSGTSPITRKEHQYFPTNCWTL